MSLCRSASPAPPALIEYCLNNVAPAERQAWLGSGWPVAESSCLQRCGRCHASPYVVVDGRPISGPSHAALRATLDARRGESA